eukprot:scaffold12544_cov27-Phaeocystis_antarctica.AAC.1
MILAALSLTLTVAGHEDDPRRPHRSDARGPQRLRRPPRPSNTAPTYSLSLYLLWLYLLRLYLLWLYLLQVCLAFQLVFAILGMQLFIEP